MKPIKVTQSGIGESDWKLVNWNIAPIELGITVVVDGMVTYTVEYTLDDITDVPPVTPTAFPHATLAGLSVDAYGSIMTPVAAIRLTITGGTGSATLTFIQSGISGN